VKAAARTRGEEPDRLQAFESLPRRRTRLAQERAGGRGSLAEIAAATLAETRINLPPVRLTPLDEFKAAMNAWSQQR